MSRRKPPDLSVGSVSKYKKERSGLYMLVGFLSDLHIDHIFNGLSKKKTENVLVEFIKRKELDYIVFSGDISGNWSLSLDILDCINQRTNTKAFMVSGNHDIWDLNKNTGRVLQE